MSSNHHDQTNSDQAGHAERAALIGRLQFLGQMQSTETALFHQKAAARNGLSITDSKTISTLQQEGDMTAGALAVRLSLTTGAITNVIDRLEHSGLVRRVADPHDRRKVIVTIVLENLEKMAGVYDSIGDAFMAALSDYSLDRLRFLVEYYTLSIELTKQEIAKLSETAR